MVVRNRKLAQTKWANASYIAANLNDFNTGWAFVQGSCGGANFTRGLGSPKKVCGGLTVKTTFSGASFTVGNWTLTVHGNYVYGRISGPQHRLDLAFKARGDAPARSLPHGIIGQSFSSTAPRHGKKDLYPKEGRTVTSAMAEGAIEGRAAQYEMPSPHATNFAFSRFEGAEAPAPRLSPPLADMEASATERSD